MYPASEGRSLPQPHLQLLQKSLTRCPRPMRIYNTMPRNFPDNHTGRAPLKFKRSNCASFIQPCQIFRTILSVSQAAHLSLTEFTIALLIMSQQVLIEIPKVEFESRAPPGQFISCPQMYPGTHRIWTSYRTVSSLKYLRQLYTALEVITFELRALLAAWDEASKCVKQFIKRKVATLRSQRGHCKLSRFLWPMRYRFSHQSICQYNVYISALCSVFFRLLLHMVLFQINLLLQFNESAIISAVSLYMLLLLQIFFHSLYFHFVVIFITHCIFFFLYFLHNNKYYVNHSSLSSFLFSCVFIFTEAHGSSIIIWHKTPLIV